MIYALGAIAGALFGSLVVISIVDWHEDREAQRRGGGEP